MQPPTKEEKQAYWHNVKKVLVMIINHCNNWNHF